jgi:hypothetical protein
VGRNLTTAVAVVSLGPATAPAQACAINRTQIGSLLAKSPHSRRTSASRRGFAEAERSCFAWDFSWLLGPASDRTRLQLDLAPGSRCISPRPARTLPEVSHAAQPFCPRPFEGDHRCSRTFDFPRLGSGIMNRSERAKSLLTRGDKDRNK